MEEEEGLLRGGSRRWRWAEEGKRLGYVAAPMVAVALCQYLVQLMSMMMVGHLGELPLASAALATSITAVTGFSLLLGMASGLETLCGQAYGARQYQKLGIYMYRSMICLLLVCIPIFALWLNLGKLLVLIHQDPMISHEAGRYAAWLIPGLFAYAIAQSIMKFLQSQSLIFPMLFASLATLCLHIPLCWLLVFRCGMGNSGAAVAISLSYWVNVAILGSYVGFSSSCEETRVSPSREAFRGIYEFLRVAIPSAVMICLVWWSFELLVLLSGLLPNPQLETSVLSVCLTAIFTLFQIPYGLGAAASTRVSNELGAGNSEQALLVVRVVMLIAATEASVLSIIIFLLRNIAGYAFSSEDEVALYVAKMTPLISCMVILNGLHVVLSGIARGCGWQYLGAYANLVAFYMVGIPMAILLGFWVNLRGMGLLIGILIGAAVQTAILSLITSFTNWEKQVENAQIRIFGEKLLSSDVLI